MEKVIEAKCEAWSRGVDDGPPKEKRRPGKDGASELVFRPGTDTANSADLQALADEIKTEHYAYEAHRDAAKRAVIGAIQHAQRAGELLIQAKLAVPHGQWMAWVAANCRGISHRSVTIYMEVARGMADPELAARIPDAANLSMRDVLRALAKPKPEKVEANPVSNAAVTASTEPSPYIPPAPPVPLLPQSEPAEAAPVEQKVEEEFAPLPAQKPMKRMSRTARWQVAAERAAQAIEELVEMKDEFQSWLDGLPENLQGSATADKLQAIVDIDFDSALEVMQEAAGADLPLGFGRD